MRLNGGCATDVGNTRAVNQDAIFFRCVKKRSQYFALGAVCDGIGGLTHGELASQKVINAVAQWFEGVTEWMDIDKIETDILFSHFKDAAEEWNGEVRELICDNGFMTGTTMSALMIIRDRYYIIHVGDSRICLYHDELWQLTEDETTVKAAAGKMKRYLSNYMGKEDTLRFTTVEGVVREGDMFLYGSDGLFHCLEADDVGEIYHNCSMKKNLYKECTRLIEEIKRRGERDNISAGIIITGRDRRLLSISRD